MVSHKFSTKDLAKAAYASLNGFELVDSVKVRQSVYFYFDTELDEGSIASLFLDYENRKALVEPLDFMRAVNQFRSKVFELR